MSDIKLADPMVGKTIQVALVTESLEPTMDELLRLGIGPFSVYRLDADNSEVECEGKPCEMDIRLAMTEEEGMPWEVIQPISGENLFTEFLGEGKGGFHHVGIDCYGASYEERTEELERRGYDYRLGGRAFGGPVRFGFFTRNAPGAPIVEVYEYPEGFDFADHVISAYPAESDTT